MPDRNLPNRPIASHLRPSRPCLEYLRQAKGCTLDFHASHGNVDPGLLVDWPWSNGGKTYSKNTSAISSLTAEYKMGDVTLTSVTGYFYMQSRLFETLDVTTLRSLPTSIGETDHAFSQEFRVSTQFDGPVNLMMGAFYQNSRLTERSLPMLVYLGPDPVTGRYPTWDRFAHMDGNT